MSLSNITAEITAATTKSIKTKLTQDFITSCNNATTPNHLAGLVYNYATKNSTVNTWQDWPKNITSFQEVLTQIGNTVGLRGTWTVFGTESRKLYCTPVTNAYTGSSYVQVSNGTAIVKECAFWLPTT